MGPKCFQVRVEPKSHGPSSTRPPLGTSKTLGAEQVTAKHAASSASGTSSKHGDKQRSELAQSVEREPGPEREAALPPETDPEAKPEERRTVNNSPPMPLNLNPVLGSRRC
ncbi:hypothetical protein BJV74DRAFT_125385 [Russula compacta]|nr:hypothetical protein BJV74DRAFT_125385 [Russula compacta]